MSEFVIELFSRPSRVDDLHRVIAVRNDGSVLHVDDRQSQMSRPQFDRLVNLLRESGIMNLTSDDLGDPVALQNENVEVLIADSRSLGDGGELLLKINLDGIKKELCSSNPDWKLATHPDIESFQVFCDVKNYLLKVGRD